MFVSVALYSPVTVIPSVFQISFWIFVHSHSHVQYNLCSAADAGNLDENHYFKVDLLLK